MTTYLSLTNKQLDDTFEEYIPANIVGLTELEELHIMVDRDIYLKVGEYQWICQN